MSLPLHMNFHPFHASILLVCFSIHSLLTMHPVFCVHFGILRQMVCLKPVDTLVYIINAIITPQE